PGAARFQLVLKQPIYEPAPPVRRQRCNVLNDPGAFRVIRDAGPYRLKSLPYGGDLIIAPTDLFCRLADRPGQGTCIGLNRVVTAQRRCRLAVYFGNDKARIMSPRTRLCPRQLSQE